MVNFTQITMRINAYFKNLTRPELISWAAIGIGLIVLLIGMILL